MCPRSQSWRAIGSHVQYDGTTDKYNEREKKRKKSAPVKTREADKTSDHSGKQEEGLCVLLQPRERCTDSVKEHFLKQLWCVHNKATAPFFFFFLLIKCVDCDMSRRTNEQQHIRGDTRKVSETRGDTHTHSHNHWGGQRGRNHTAGWRRHVKPASGSLRLWHIEWRSSISYCLLKLH